MQWSHYADRHRGICLGFEVTGDPEKFGKVRYVSEKEPAPAKPDLAFVWRALTTKLKIWEYEREWRVFTTLEDGLWNEGEGRMLYFADFGKELALKQVILGASNPIYAKEVSDLVGPDVRVTRVHLGDEKFELTLADCVRV